MRERIQSLDGLRFLAAMGVLWIHTWTIYGNNKLSFGPINIANFLAIGGNGVDLFFVISGFCMYYFYAHKTDFSYYSFIHFIKKRWIRLSPAFYVATFVYILFAKYTNHSSDFYLKNLLNSIFYSNSITPQYNIAGHFWTLGVEWQFYLIIPFLLIYQSKVGFKKVFIAIFAILQILAFTSIFILKTQSDILTNQILFRGIEFAWGIIAARIILKHQFTLKYRWLWLIVFIIITYSGRVLISKNILSLSAHYYNLFKIAGFTLMGLGFAGILYLSLTSTGYLSRILGNRFFKNAGRISYSFYLWHELILWIVSSYLSHIIPDTKNTNLPLFVTLACTFIVLYPISLLSYNLLEKPFLSAGNLTTK